MRYCPECNQDVDHWEDVDDGWICKECNKFVPKEGYCVKCEEEIVKEVDGICASCGSIE